MLLFCFRSYCRPSHFCGWRAHGAFNVLRHQRALCRWLCVAQGGAWQGAGEAHTSAHGGDARATPQVEAGHAAAGDGGGHARARSGQYSARFRSIAFAAATAADHVSLLITWLARRYRNNKCGSTFLSRNTLNSYSSPDALSGSICTKMGMWAWCGRLDYNKCLAQKGRKPFYAWSFVVVARTPIELRSKRCFKSKQTALMCAQWHFKSYFIQFSLLMFSLSIFAAREMCSLLN